MLLEYVKLLCWFNFSNLRFLGSTVFLTFFDTGELQSDCAHSYVQTNFNICSGQGSFSWLVFVLCICSKCFCALLCTWFCVAVLHVSVVFFHLNKVSIVVCVSGCCTSSHIVAGLAIFDSMNPWFVSGTPARLWVPLLVIYLLLFGSLGLFGPLFLFSVVHWYLLSLQSFAHPCVLHWMFLVKVPYFCLNLCYIVYFLPRFHITGLISVWCQLVWATGVLFALDSIGLG